MPLLTTVLLSSSRDSERIASVLYSFTYCFNIAPRQCFRHNARFSGNPCGQSWVIISLSRSSSSKTLTSWHWTLLRCETSERRGVCNPRCQEAERRGKGRSVCTFVSGLETGERERTGPREAQSDDGQSQAGQGRSNTGGISWIWQDPWYSVQHKFYQIDLLDSYLVVIFKWTNKILAGWEG